MCRIRNSIKVEDRRHLYDYYYYILILLGTIDPNGIRVDSIEIINRQAFKIKKKL